MTLQARRLLKHLRKAQMHEDGQIYIDFEELTVTGVHCKGQSYNSVNLKNFKNSIHSILQYLKDLGYVAYDDFGQAKVLHPGWNWMQIQLSRFINFLFTSVFVPIFVSVVTSIIVTVIALLFK